MSASSEIRFKIGADTSALSRGLMQAETIAASAGSAIKKKLSMKDAFKSGVLALGLSIEKLSENLAEMFTGGSQAAWKSALDSANEAARTIEESTLRRMSTLRQIAELEKEIQRNAANEVAEPKKGSEPGFVRKTLDAIGETMFSSAAKVFEKLGAGPNTVGSLRKSADIFRKRGAGEDIEEKPAEVQQRAAKATAERLAKEARIAELKEKSDRDAGRVSAAQKDLDRMKMSDMEKALSLEDDLVEAEFALTEAKRKGKETVELELDVIRKKKALEEQLLKIERNKSEEEKKRKQAREQIARAQGRVGDARQNLADARHDAVAPGLQELASGSRGMASDRIKAKRILQLEERARKLHDSGRTITEFDSRTQRNVQVNSGALMNRAAQMRKDFGKINTGDQDPMKAAVKELSDANEHLAEIKKSLATTETE